MKRPIELRRVRDFGQVINDSFTFLKENYKPLFTSLLIICGFFLVLGTVTTSFTYLKMSDMTTGDIDSYDGGQYDYLIGLFITFAVLVLTQACIHLVTVCYISVYVQKNNTQPTLAEVWGYFKYYLLRVFGSSVVVWLMFILGFALCLIPGFYLLPILSLIVPIIVIENASFGYAFNTSFRLIKENWWPTFGVIFVTTLIVGIMGSFAGYPLTFIAVGSKFISLQKFRIPLIIFFSALRNLLTITYTLPYIATCLCYFNLSEQKDGLGLLGRIEKFGTRTDDNLNLPTEEY